MILRRLSIIILIGIVACGKAYSVSAVDIIRKAQTADVHVSYRGSKTVCIVMDGRQVCSQMQVTHLKPGMTRTQYFSPKAVAGVVSVRRGDAVWRYSPVSKEWERASCASSYPTKCDIGIVLTNFSVRLVSSQKILGRDAYVVVATPKRAGEYVIRLWVDKQSYLTLKTQIEKPDGKVTSFTNFTKIVVNPKDISLSVFAVPDKKIVRPTISRPSFKVSMPKYLPKGYKLVGEACEKACDYECLHLQFSNGVNTISLFEHVIGRDAKAHCVPKRLTGVMTWTRHKMLYTLIGDLPHSELQKIANSTP